MQEMRTMNTYNILKTMKRYSSRTIRASDAGNSVYRNVCGEYLDYKIDRRSVAKELSPEFIEKMNKARIQVVKKNPCGQYQWLKGQVEGKLKLLSENDPLNVKSYREYWEKIMAMVAPRVSAVAELNVQNRDFGGGLKINTEEAFDYLGLYPLGGVVSVIDLLLITSGQNVSLSDIIAGVELKREGEKIRHLESEFQLMILDVIFSLYGNKRNPIVFQTHMMDERKKGAYWAYYFEENQDYKSDSDNDNANDNANDDMEMAQEPKYCLVEQKLSGQYMFEWIRYLYQLEKNDSESKPEAETEFPLFVSIQKQVNFCLYI